MEKKKYEINAHFIMTYVKKTDPQVFLVKNEKGELDFYHARFEIEGVGFHEEKAKEMIREYMINTILGRKAFVDNQKLMMEMSGKRHVRAKYFVNLTDNKINIKNGEFVSVYDAMNVRNRMTDIVRDFLVHYVEQKKSIYLEDSSD